MKINIELMHRMFLCQFKETYVHILFTLNILALINRYLLLNEEFVNSDF